MSPVPGHPSHSNCTPMGCYLLPPYVPQARAMASAPGLGVLPSGIDTRSPEFKVCAAAATSTHACTARVPCTCPTALAVPALATRHRHLTQANTAWMDRLLGELRDNMSVAAQGTCLAVACACMHAHSLTRTQHWTQAPTLHARSRSPPRWRREGAGQAR